MGGLSGLRWQGNEHVMIRIHGDASVGRCKEDVWLWDGLLGEGYRYGLFCALYIGLASLGNKVPRWDVLRHI